mmetsp:Transcript_33407/g.87972  ORF Transcript_33407/g.87972 Transcript_33407/m.87972 type:complete len:217 (+) Transcript_33407:85-735(+)
MLSERVRTLATAIYHIFQQRPHCFVCIVVIMNVRCGRQTLELRWRTRRSAPNLQPLCWPRGLRWLKYAFKRGITSWIDCGSSQRLQDDQVAPAAGEPPTRTPKSCSIRASIRSQKLAGNTTALGSPGALARMCSTRPQAMMRSAGSKCTGDGGSPLVSTTTCHSRKKCKRPQRTPDHTRVSRSACSIRPCQVHSNLEGTHQWVRGLDRNRSQRRKA